MVDDGVESQDYDSDEVFYTLRRQHSYGNESNNNNNNRGDVVFEVGKVGANAIELDHFEGQYGRRARIEAVEEVALPGIAWDNGGSLSSHVLHSDDSPESRSSPTVFLDSYEAQATRRPSAAAIANPIPRHPSPSRSLPARLAAGSRRPSAPDAVRRPSIPGLEPVGVFDTFDSPHVAATNAAVNAPPTHERVTSGYEGLRLPAVHAAGKYPRVPMERGGAWAGLRGGGGGARLWDAQESTYRQLPRRFVSDASKAALLSPVPDREDIWGDCPASARVWVYQFIFDLKLRTFGSSWALVQEKRKHPAEQTFRKVLDPKKVQPKWENSQWRWLHYCNGIMSEFSVWFRFKLFPLCFFLDAMLRGSAQVMIANNPISGVIALAGLAVSSPWLCVCSMVGLFVSTLFAFFMGVNRAAFRGGLYGYNGMLVGGAMSVVLSGGDWNPLALAWIIPGAACSVFMTVALGTAFGGVFGSPPFTLPFIFTTMIISGCMQHSTHFRPVPALVPAFGGGLPVLGNTTAGTVFSAWMSGCGQIYIAGNPYSGLLMVLAMAVFSRVSAIGMLVGSWIGLAFAYSIGAPTAEINAGLWGYNPALLMIAMLTFYLPSVRVFVMGVVGSILSCMMTGFLDTVLKPLGLPRLTMAFSSTAFMLLLIQTSLQGIYAVPLEHITSPEDHLRKVRLMKKVAHHLRPAAWSEIVGGNE